MTAPEVEKTGFEDVEKNTDNENLEEGNEVNEDDLDDKVKGILKKERDAARKAQRELREFKAAQSKKAPSTEDSEDAVTKAKSEVEGVWKTRLVNASAKAAFLAAGAEVTPRLLKMLDLDGLTVTDDGAVEGLDEQIEDIKEDYPQLFVTTKRRSAPSDLGPKDGPKVKKTTSQIQAERIFGK